MKVLTSKVSGEQIWTWVIICYIIHWVCAPVSGGRGSAGFSFQEGNTDNKLAW